MDRWSAIFINLAGLGLTWAAGSAIQEGFYGIGIGIAAASACLLFVSPPKDRGE